MSGEQLAGLAFGTNRGVWADAAAVWGARWIWPNDVLWDRTDIVGSDDDREALVRWLNGGALQLARERAAQLAREHELASSDTKQVTLHEDGEGIVIANPQGSFGYLYVSAWLKA